MTGAFDRAARRFRVEAAARLGIARLVPADPGPEFLRIPYACEVRPSRCGECTVECGCIPDPRGVRP